METFKIIIWIMQIVFCITLIVGLILSIASSTYIRYNPRQIKVMSTREISMTKFKIIDVQPHHYNFNTEFERTFGKVMNEIKCIIVDLPPDAEKWACRGNRIYSDQIIDTFPEFFKYTSTSFEFIVRLRALPSELTLTYFINEITL